MTTLELTQNSILRINDKKTIQLIKEVRNEECLWNTSLDDYPNRTKRLKAAEKIARVLNVKNFEGKHVMIKFKNLRNSYCQELKKIAQSLAVVGSEDSPELYRPKVQWFKIMDSFIRPHLQASRPAILVSQKQQEQITPKLESCDSDPDGHDDWAIPLKETTANTGASSECASENDDVSTDSRAKRRRLSTTSITSDQISQNQIFIPNDISQNRPEDILDHFGKYIASLLRSLPPEKALILQPKIVDMIVKVGVKRESNVTVEIDRLDHSETD